MNIITLIGIIGVGILLTAFILLETKKVKSNSFLYLWLNFLGSLDIAFYSLRIYAWPLLALNVIWAVFAITKLCQQ